MRLSFFRSPQEPRVDVKLEHPIVRAATIWVEALQDGDRVFSEMHAECVAAIGGPIAHQVLSRMIRDAGFERYRYGKRKVVRYRRDTGKSDAFVTHAHSVAGKAAAKPQVDIEITNIFRRWTSQIKSGVHTFAALRESFAEWCFDADLAPISDSALSLMLKDAGYLRHRIGHRKLTIYEKPADAGCAAVAA